LFEQGITKRRFGGELKIMVKKPQIRMFTILYQYLLLIKEPFYVFLVQILQHLSPDSWWEKYILPSLKEPESKDFRYLDLIDLLNILRKNWGVINSYLMRDDFEYLYSDEYNITSAILYIRNIVAHAREIQLSSRDFINYLSYIREFAQFIQAEQEIIDRLERDVEKYGREIALRKDKPFSNVHKEEIINFIEKEVLFDAMICESLRPDVKASIIRTIIRLKSLRTIEDIIGFFNGSLSSPRGREVSEELRAHHLKTFEDIKDQINESYCPL
jgi:hypothetical protein